MPRWRVDYIGKGGKHLGAVEAADEHLSVTTELQRSLAYRAGE